MLLISYITNCFIFLFHPHIWSEATLEELLWIQNGEAGNRKPLHCPFQFTDNKQKAEWGVSLFCPDNSADFICQPNNPFANLLRDMWSYLDCIMDCILALHNYLSARLFKHNKHKKEKVIFLEWEVTVICILYPQTIILIFVITFCWRIDKHLKAKEHNGWSIVVITTKMRTIFRV